MTPYARGLWVILISTVLACMDAPEPARPPAVPLALAELAAAAPDSTRDAIERALALAVGVGETESAGHIAAARLNALAYAQAWSDSFFVRRVSEFEAAPPSRRRAMVAADSLWREGRAATGSEGVPTAMALWRESIASAMSAGDEAATARALYGLGYGFSTAGEPDSARTYLDRAYALATAAGDHRSAGNAVGILANMSSDQGDLTRAAELYEKALEIRARSGDGRGMAADENNLGLVALALGDLDQARAAFERALSLNRSAARSRPAAVNLTNLGDIATLLGDYAVAEARYAEALELNRADGDVAETAFVLHDLGLLATRRGDYRGAVQLLGRSFEIHEQSGAAQHAVAVRADLAAAYAALGEHERAIAVLDGPDTRASEAALPPDIRARVELARADLAFQLGAFARADAAFAGAERLFREAADELGRAEALEGRGLLQLERDEPARARELFALAARARAGAGDPRAAAATQMLIAEAHRADSDTAAARSALDEAAGTFERLGDAGGLAASLAALGDLARLRGTPLLAEERYRRGLGDLGALPFPDVRWRLHAGLGAALRARGALAAAASELRAAVDAVEEVASKLSVDDRRTGFLSDKWEVYAALARTEQQLGRPAQAFTISERMRARQMLTLLDHGRVRVGDRAAAREQDLRRRIAELSRDLESEESVGVTLREPSFTGLSAGAAREALASAQREYADLLLGMAAREPDYVRLVRGATADWRSVASGLAANEVLLQYLVADSTSTVFVVKPDSVIAIDLGIGRRTISGLVDFARHAMSGPDEGLAPPLWHGVLRRLHDYLIEPVAEGGHLEGVQRLVVVPHAELHFLPFGALLYEEEGEGGFLVERFELAYAPSASVWVHLREREGRRLERVLALAPHPTRLPASEHELAGIRSGHGRRNSTLLVGSAASEAALRAAARYHDVIHLATYGVLNKHNPLFSHIELSPQGSDDGRLEVHEVFDLELDGQLVVLSACQTAVSSGSLADVPPGDEWVGLLQAFLQAGAGSVVASLWAVEDDATAEVMTRFHGAIASGAPAATALAHAQRSLLRDPDTAHPFYWAAFIASGQQERGERGR